MHLPPLEDDLYPERSGDQDSLTETLLAGAVSLAARGALATAAACERIAATIRRNERLQLLFTIPALAMLIAAAGAVDAIAGAKLKI